MSAAKKPRILFVSSLSQPPFWGGSEKYWFETILHREFRDRFECMVLMRRSEVTRLRAKELEQVGVHVRWWEPHVGRRIKRLAHVGREIIRAMGAQDPTPLRGDLPTIVRRQRPDLVWLNLAGPGATAIPAGLAAACKELDIPLWIILQHAPEHFFYGSDQQTEQIAGEYLGATRVVCIARRNRMALERAIGYRLDNAWMSQNSLPVAFWERGEDVMRESPVRDAGTARLLSLARFDPYFKGQHILLEVLVDPAWRARDWHLTLQGGGRLAGLLDRLIRYFGIPAERIESHPHRPDVHSAIGDSDLLVMPSLSEGTPFALVEAMACGRSAVATPVGGMVDLIHHGVTGWLSRSVKVSDVADAMEAAWRMRSSWSRIGSAARESVRYEYDQTRAISEIIGALEKDLGILSPSASLATRPYMASTIAGGP